MINYLDTQIHVDPPFTDVVVEILLDMNKLYSSNGIRADRMCPES
eukprot:SAG11_NODE_1882_length_4128_cov_2.284438_1_plen_45_part_00